MSRTDNTLDENIENILAALDDIARDYSSEYGFPMHSTTFIEAAKYIIKETLELK